MSQNISNIYFEGYSLADILQLNRYSRDFENILVTRDYRWDQQQVLVLLHDLTNVVNHNFTKHFCGSAILSAPLNNKSEECIIVEGQQRVLTTSIMTRVIYHEILKTGQALYAHDRTIDTSRLKYIPPAKLGVHDPEQIEILTQLRTFAPTLTNRIRITSQETQEIFTNLELMIDNLATSKTAQEYLSHNMVQAYLTSKSYFERFATTHAQQVAQQMRAQGIYTEEQINLQVQFARVNVYLNYYKALNSTVINTTIFNGYHNFKYINDIHLKGRDPSNIEHLFNIVLNGISSDALPVFLANLYKIEDLVVGMDVVRKGTSPVRANDEVGTFIDRALKAFFTNHNAHPMVFRMDMNNKMKVLIQMLRSHLQQQLPYFIEKYGINPADSLQLASPHIGLNSAVHEDPYSLNTSKFYFRLSNNSDGEKTEIKPIPTPYSHLELRDFDIRDITVDDEIFKSLLLNELRPDFQGLIPTNFECEMYLMQQLAIMYAQAYNLIKFVETHQELQTEFYQLHPELVTKLIEFKRLNLKAPQQYMLFLTKQVLSQRINALEFTQCIDLICNYLRRNLVTKRNTQEFAHAFTFLLKWNVYRPIAMEFFFVEVISEHNHMPDDFTYLTKLLQLNIHDSTFTDFYAGHLNYLEELKSIQAAIIKQVAPVLFTDHPEQTLRAQPDLVRRVQDQILEFAQLISNELVIYEFQELHNITRDKLTPKFLAQTAQILSENLHRGPNQSYKLDFSNLCIYESLDTDNQLYNIRQVHNKANYMYDLLRDYFPNNASESELFVRKYQERMNNLSAVANQPHTTTARTIAETTPAIAPAPSAPQETASSTTDSASQASATPSAQEQELFNQAMGSAQDLMHNLYGESSNAAGQKHALEQRLNEKSFGGQFSMADLFAAEEQLHAEIHNETTVKNSADQQAVAQPTPSKTSTITPAVPAPTSSTVSAPNMQSFMAHGVQSGQGKTPSMPLALDALTIETTTSSNSGEKTPASALTTAPVEDADNADTGTATSNATTEPTSQASVVQATTTSSATNRAETTSAEEPTPSHTTESAATSSASDSARVMEAQASTEADETATQSAPVPADLATSTTSTATTTETANDTATATIVSELATSLDLTASQAQTTTEATFKPAVELDLNALSLNATSAQVVMPVAPTVSPAQVVTEAPRGGFEMPPVTNAPPISQVASTYGLESPVAIQGGKARATMAQTPTLDFNIATLNNLQPITAPQDHEHMLQTSSLLNSNKEVAAVNKVSMDNPLGSTTMLSLDGLGDLGAELSNLDSGRKLTNLLAGNESEAIAPQPSETPVAPSSKIVTSSRNKDLHSNREFEAQLAEIAASIEEAKRQAAEAERREQEMQRNLEALKAKEAEAKQLLERLDREQAQQQAQVEKLAQLAQKQKVANQQTQRELEAQAQAQNQAKAEVERLRVQAREASQAHARAQEEAALQAQAIEQVQADKDHAIAHAESQTQELVNVQAEQQLKTQPPRELGETHSLGGIGRPIAVMGNTESAASSHHDKAPVQPTPARTPFNSASQLTGHTTHVDDTGNNFNLGSALTLDGLSIETGGLNALTTNIPVHKAQATLNPTVTLDLPGLVQPSSPKSSLDMETIQGLGTIKPNIISNLWLPNTTLQVSLGSPKYDTLQHLLNHQDKVAQAIITAICKYFETNFSNMQLVVQDNYLEITFDAEVYLQINLSTKVPSVVFNLDDVADIDPRVTSYLNSHNPRLDRILVIRNPDTIKLMFALLNQVYATNDTVALQQLLTQLRSYSAQRK